VALSGPSTGTRAWPSVVIDTDCAVALACDGKGARHVLELNGRPPAVVLGSIPGEALLADIGPIPSINGSGMALGSPFAVSHREGGARLPLAYSWLGLQFAGNNSWVWKGEQARTQKIPWQDAIAEYAVSVLRKVHDRPNDVAVCLTVPNTLDLDSQTTVLRALRGRGMRDSTLLWRPVAAALGWLDHAPMMDQIQIPERTKGVLGRLLVVDLSLAGFEVTALELLRDPALGGNHVLPTRHLPSLPVLHGEGLRIADFIGLRLAAKTWEQADGAVWNQVWCTDLLRQLQMPSPPGEDATSLGPAHKLLRQLADVVAGGSSLPDQSNVHGGLVWRCAPMMSSPRRPLLSYSACGKYDGKEAERSSSDLVKWLQVVRDRIPAGPPFLGAVAIGALAGVQAGARTGDTLGRVLVNALEPRLHPDAVLVEAAARRVCLVADGAARFLEMKANGLTPYLDTLPELETLARRLGEPAWIPLLEEGSRYVAGGVPKEYRTPEGSFAVGAEESKLKLTVWQEGAPTVREVEFAFPRPLEKTTPVQLVLNITPGQGNPRVEVVPLKDRIFAGRRFFLDWERAQDTQKDKNEAIADMDRLFPQLEPRLASEVCWSGGDWLSGYRCPGARKRIEDFIKLRNATNGEPSVDGLKRIRELLQEADTNLSGRDPPDHGTAIGSDGNLAVGSGDPLLMEFIRLLDGWLNPTANDVLQDEICRVLGYCSADSPMLRRRLANLIRSAHNIREPHLTAIGNCVRSPTVIASFVEAVIVVLKDPNRGPNLWIRALCRLLMYRADALESTSSAKCDELTEILLYHVNAAVKCGTFQYIYRHASLSIAYSLRRRRYDPDYLDPSGTMGCKTKEAFHRAIEQLKRPGVQQLGGFHDLEVVTNRILDYINRKGRGRLLA